MATDRFSGLPPELRNAIYSMSVIPQGITSHRHVLNGAVRVYPRDAAALDPPIMGVCRALRREVSQIYYASNDFELSVRMEELQTVAQWLSNIVELCGATPFRSLTIDFRDASYMNFESIFPLVDMLRTSQLNHHTFRFRTLVISQRRTTLGSVLLEASDLGETGRQRGWDAERMRNEFDSCMSSVKQRPYVEGRYRREA